MDICDVRARFQLAESLDLSRKQSRQGFHTLVHLFYFLNTCIIIVCSDFALFFIIIIIIIIIIIPKKAKENKIIFKWCDESAFVKKKAIIKCVVTQQ